MQHRRFPITVASRDSLCPPPPRAREAELPTAKGEGGGPGVSVGGMVGVVSGGVRGWLPMWAGAGEEVAASTKIYVCLWPELPGRVRWPDQLARRVGPYVQYVWGPVAGTAKCPSQ